MLNFQKEEPGRTLVAFSPPRKEWLPEWAKVKDFVIAGDGMPGLDIEGKRLTWDQYTFEVYYRLQVTEQFALTPDIQYLFDPAQNPTQDSLWIFGLRARLAL